MNTERLVKVFLQPVSGGNQTEVRLNPWDGIPAFV